MFYFPCVMRLQTCAPLQKKSPFFQSTCKGSKFCCNYPNLSYKLFKTHIFIHQVIPTYFKKSATFSE